MLLKAALLLGAAGGALAGLNATPTKPFIGGYVLINGPNGLAKMSLLANSAATLPITRLFVSFVTPTMVYVPGSATLATSGLNLSATGDEGFAALQGSIKTLVAAGVDVFLSLGGWDFNCFPYTYTRYSVGGYGTGTPNWWKIVQYCNGDVNNASPANNYCYTCEPPYSNETLGDFDMFPEPAYSPTWQAAIAYVAATAGGGAPPTWDGIENGNK